jgi:hypothetical protein
MSLEKIIQALDDRMKPQPDSSPRPITPEVLKCAKGTMKRTTPYQRSEPPQHMVS